MSGEAIAADASSQPPMSKKERLARSTAQVLEEAPDLVTLSTRILGALKKYKPVTVEGMDPALHWLPPHISKSEWTALGNLVVEREKAAGVAGRVSGEMWISLRLDGSNFSKVGVSCEVGHHQQGKDLRECCGAPCQRRRSSLRGRAHVVASIAQSCLHNEYFSFLSAPCIVSCSWLHLRWWLSENNNQQQPLHRTINFYMYTCIHTAHHTGRESHAKARDLGT